MIAIQISYPSLNEQTRIATILSDMDAEISLLEKRLEKETYQARHDAELANRKRD